MVFIKREIIYIIFFLILAAPVYAIGIGLSPGKMNVTGMLRGGYAERTIKITTDSEDNISIVKVVDDSEIKGWLSFDPSENYTISKTNPLNLKVIINPPSDVRNGVYHGRVNFRTVALTTFEGRTGSIIQTAVASDLYINIVDIENLECSALSADVDSVEKGDIATATISIVNEGNVRFKPAITIDIWDKNQENIVKIVKYNKEEIKPTVKKDIKVDISTNDLEIGQYFAEISINKCSLQNRLLTFDVMEVGSLTVSGKIIEIRNKVWNYVDEIIPITIVFQNTGKRSYSAKFKGNIKLGDELIELVETEELNVLVGETVEFLVHFTPKKPGRYILNGRVFYGKKQSFEKGSIINVNPEGFDHKTGQFVERKSKIPKIIIYSIIIIIIILILIIIKKKKQRKKYSF